MLLASVIKSASLLLVQWCFFLPISFFISNVAEWQPHSPNSVTTAYLLDLSYYDFLSASPCSNAVHCSVQQTQMFFC